MQSIACIISGSRAFGTDIPGSDTDLKGVHIPVAADIVMQRVAPAQRMPGGDHESHALNRFMVMVAEGQPIAVEMVFAPPSLWATDPSPVWLDLLANRDRLLTAQTAFRRYSERQAQAFGGKGGRLAALQAVTEVLRSAMQTHGAGARLSAAEADLAGLTAHGIEVVPSGDGRNRLLRIGDKQSPMAGSIVQALTLAETSLARYGSRALRASTEGGVDWKALMHALRLSEEGAEYHLMGKVSLPRPNADYLRSIRLGQVALGEVEAAIAEAAQGYLQAEARSVLPMHADQVWMDDFVYQHYGEAVARVFAVQEEPGPSAFRL